MRTLNKKQKNLIDKWIKDNYNGAGSLYSSDQMPIELQQELERINDHETIWHNIDRYIGDEVLKIAYGT
jgi:hypothetical protein